MFCNQCGTQLKEGMKFCINCGARTDDRPQPQVPKAVPRAQPGQGSGSLDDTHSSAAGVAGGQPISQGMNPVVLWGGIVFLVTAVLVTAFLIYHRSPSPALPSDAEIEKALEAKFAADPNLSKCALEVHSQSGVVTLVGHVSTESDKSVAASIATQQEGVKQVNVYGIVVAGQMLTNPQVTEAGNSIGGAHDNAFLITGRGQFGIINLHTGAFTELGNPGVLLGGLGVYRSSLYGGQHNGNMLYRVNPANGNMTPIGKGNISDFNLFGSTTTGLYALDSSFNLHSVDPATGATTLIGPTGFSAPGCCTALSSGATTLYFVTTQSSGTTLYMLNTATGAPTMIGPTGTGDIGSLAFVNGTLYAGAYRGGIYALNKSTGRGTLVSGSPSEFWGLAAANTVAVIANQPSIGNTQAEWFGFANETSAQDREAELRRNCGVFRRVYVPRDVGNRFADLCSHEGKTCERVCDWEGISLACSAVSLGGMRDGTRIALCR